MKKIVYLRIRYKRVVMVLVGTLNFYELELSEQEELLPTIAPIFLLYFSI